MELIIFVVQFNYCISFSHKKKHLLACCFSKLQALQARDQTRKVSTIQRPLERHTKCASILWRILPWGEASHLFPCHLWRLTDNTVEWWCSQSLPRCMLKALTQACIKLKTDEPTCVQLPGSPHKLPPDRVSDVLQGRVIAASLGAVKVCQPSTQIVIWTKICINIVKQLTNALLILHFYGPWKQEGRADASKPKIEASDKPKSEDWS